MVVLVLEIKSLSYLLAAGSAKEEYVRSSCNTS